MGQHTLKILVAIFTFLAVACGYGGDDQTGDQTALLEAPSYMMGSDGGAPAANKKLKINNNSDYDVTVKYKDADGTEQEVRVRAGSSGSVSDFGGGEIKFSPADSVEGTRVDGATQTTITFKNKPGGGLDGGMPSSDGGMGMPDGM